MIAHRLWCTFALLFVAVNGWALQTTDSSLESTQITNASDVSPSIRKAIIHTVATLAPRATVQTIVPEPFGGLYQVVTQGQVLYMTGNGRYVIHGEAFDVIARTSFNRRTMSRLRRTAISKLSPDQMIRFAPAHPKYTVTVFADIDCPYCKAFHAKIKEINRLGIAVDYLFWPRSGLGTPSAQKAVDIWCAADRKAALTHAFEGDLPRHASCKSPIAQDYNLGIDLGVNGTPIIMANDGTVLGGYLDPGALLDRVEATRGITRKKPRSDSR